MSATTHELLGALAHHEFLRQQLRLRFPEADEEVLADTLEGISDLDMALAEVARSREEDLALADALKQRMDDMRARFDRLKLRADTKRDIISSVMERADLKKVTAPDLTLSLGAGRARVIVTDEAAVIAEGYGRTKTVVEVDKEALGIALKAGDGINGAMLSNPAPILTIRTK